MNTADTTLAHHVASEVACLFLLNEGMYIPSKKDFSSAYVLLPSLAS